MPTYPVRRKLPSSYSTQIGRIITRWAWLEWELKHVVYTILDVNPKAGRLSVREPRADEYLTMIQDLMQVYGLSFSPQLKPHLKSANKALAKLGNLRNALAHGIWIKRPETRLPVLQVVTGGLINLANLPQPLPKAKIEPQALTIELSGLKAATHDIEELTRFIRAMHNEIAPQLYTSPKKLASLPRARVPHRGHTQAKPRSPPRSSRV